MPGPLQGLIVLVTGAASGIGRQLCTDLWVREGCSVRLADRDAAGLASIEEELRRAAPPEGRLLTAHVVDVASEDSVRALAAAVGDGPLDVLVNCAGVLCLGPFERTPIEEVERIVGINLLGTVRTTRALLPRLLASPRAFIVNVASAAGLFGAPGMAAYAASKFGVVGFSQALRIELAGRAGVCAVCPTLVRTAIVARSGVAGREEADAERRRGEMDAQLHRLGASPERASRAIVRAIVKRKRLVLVNPDAWVLHTMHRFFPCLTEFIVRKLYRKLQRDGVLDA